MYLVQILLPLYDNSGRSFDRRDYEQTRDELTARFGGITSYIRSPAEGVWRGTPTKMVRDDIVIYEVMTEQLDRSWWRSYREKLTARVRQDLLIVRVSQVELL